LAGLALGASAFLLWQGKRSGALLYGLLLLVTLGWGIAEVGLDFWPLISRLLALSIIGLWLLMPWTRRRLYATEPPPLLKGRAGLAGLVVAVIVVAVVISAAVREEAPQLSPRVAAKSADTSRTDWRNYGNTKAGTRFAQLDQINAQNVKDLKVA